MRLDVVVKVTKLCNLRCSYCYETPWLDDPRRMKLSQIDALYDRVAEMIAAVGDTSSAITFYWQGGEPMLVPASFWKGVYERQDRFEARDGVCIRNELQSNATRVTDEHVDALRGRYVVGVSYDVANDNRRTAGGRPTARLVETGIERLRAGGVQLSGGIAVVSTANVDHAASVVEFYLGQGLNLRLLNIYTATDTQPAVARAAVGWDRYIDFCRDALDVPGMREAMSAGLTVEPFTSAFRIRRLTEAGAAVTPSDGRREWVLLVDTSGDLYSAGDAYDNALRYGNVFDDTLNTLFLSPARARRIARARERIERICASGCEFFGHGCDGAYVGQCTPEEERAFAAAGRCYLSVIAGMERN